MNAGPDKPAVPSSTQRLDPAQPLWRLAPTHAADGRSVADFMMLIPGLGTRPAAARSALTERVREVCEAYGSQVVFADINYSLNVLWVSVDAEPGLAARVANSIRGRVPDARLVGGQLGAVPPLVATGPQHPRGWWARLRLLSRRGVRRLGLPGAD